MFQTIYAAPQVWWPLLVLSLEWWSLVCLMLGLAPVWNPLTAAARTGILGPWAFSPFANPFLVLPVLMLGATAAIAFLVAGQASPPFPSAGGGRGSSSRPCTWPSPWSAAGRGTRRAS